MKVPVNGNSSADMQYFHGHPDQESVNYAHPPKPSTTKYLIVQERDLGYRFHAHFHPYVDRLTQALTAGGTAGLLAADTLYTADGASLPGSVTVSLPPAATVPLAARTPLALAAATTADLPGGGTIQLSGDLVVEPVAAAPATAPAGIGVTLADGLPSTPAPGSEQILSINTVSFVRGSAALSLTGATRVELPDGTAAVLRAGCPVVLPAGTSLTLPAGTRTTVVAALRRPQLYEDIFTATSYRPGAIVRRPYPVKDLDFSYGGAYAVYNWELFFHVPFTMAVHLSKNQRFAEAQRWFHGLFDPTDDSDGPTPERFWKVRPFQQTDVRQVEEILVNLSTDADPELREATVRSIGAWKQAPFRPHVIARYRQQAYMYATVMAYLDNLIAWGDSLFRQDTGEAIDEALMLYALAAEILGPRPQPLPRKGSVRPQTYHNLRSDLRQFGSAMRDLEADLGFDLMPFPGGDTVDGDRLATVRSLGKALYFGVPANSRLLAYWDTVADRLFKIRNSLNLQGTFRQVPLFAAPIDPALLARAAASGLDVGAIVTGLNQPLPLVRFAFLVQKAAEICQQVTSLGANLLSVMEKQDAEALAVLRSQHEQAVLKMTEDVRYTQLQEAAKAREGVLLSLAVVIQRYAYYERQLGRTPDEIAAAVPVLEDLDRQRLTDRTFAMTEPAIPLRDIEVDIDTDVLAQAAQVLAGGRLLSSHEVRESLFLEGGQVAADIANMLTIGGTGLAAIPQFEISAEPMGIGGATAFGGQNISAIVQSFAATARGISDRLAFEARRAARIDSFARREREWAYQSNLAAGEITQTFKQLRAAQLREAVAELELAGHRQQMRQAEEVAQFLDGKPTGQALYVWMKREVKALYAQCFSFAFDIARKAERALQHELGRTDLSYLQYGYLAGKEGLLAGEKLALDIKRMEMAYHDLNEREYELTKHVSVLELDPLAVIRLRRTGRTTVRLSEAAFDMDGPGHYFRRIKSVALTIPSVTGPYVSVNCTLSLLKSSIRTSPVLRDGDYAREDADDDRFSDYLGGIRSVATSSAQNDSGLFETNLRDERYLPFENAGAISEWSLELPADPSSGDPLPFDYDTISDVILHVRYTAREGGGLLRRSAVSALSTLIADAAAPGSTRLLSVRHEFATSWSRFRTDIPETGEHFALTLPLRAAHYPYWSTGRLDSTRRVVLYGRSSLSTAGVFDSTGAANDTMTAVPALGGLLVGELAEVPKPATPDEEITLYFDTNAFTDMWIAVTWAG